MNNILNKAQKKHSSAYAILIQVVTKFKYTRRQESSSATRRLTQQHYASTFTFFIVVDCLYN